jgi:hypothetical protein
MKCPDGCPYEAADDAGAPFQDKPEWRVRLQNDHSGELAAILGE